MSLSARQVLGGGNCGYAGGPLVIREEKKRRGGQTHTGGVYLNDQNHMAILALAVSRP